MAFGLAIDSLYSGQNVWGKLMTITKGRADVERLAGNKPSVIINMRIWKHVTLLNASP